MKQKKRGRVGGRKHEKQKKTHKSLLRSLPSARRVLEHLPPPRGACSCPLPAVSKPSSPGTSSRVAGAVCGELPPARGGLADSVTPPENCHFPPKEHGETMGGSLFGGRGWGWGFLEGTCPQMWQVPVCPSRPRGQDLQCSPRGAPWPGKLSGLSIPTPGVPGQMHFGRDPPAAPGGTAAPAGTGGEAT